jgi:hypothetical protein
MARRRWVWAFPAVLLGFPLLLTIAGFLVHRHSYGAVAAELPEALAEAKKEGFPTTIEQMRAMIATPADQNAANDYRAAFSALRLPQTSGPAGSNSDRRGLTYDPIERVVSQLATPEQENEASRVLSANSAALEWTRHATGKKGLDWGRPWELGPSLIYGELPKMKSLAKLLCAQAILDAKRGDSRGAFQRLSEVSRIGRHVGQEPTLIGLLVQDAIDKMATAAALYILEFRHDPASLDAALAFCAQLPPLAELPFAFDGEAILMISRIQRPSEDLTNYVPMGPQVALVRDPVFRQAMATHRPILDGRQTHGPRRRVIP